MLDIVTEVFCGHAEIKRTNISYPLGPACDVYFHTVHIDNCKVAAAVFFLGYKHVPDIKIRQADSSFMYPPDNAGQGNDNSFFFRLSQPVPP